MSSALDNWSALTTQAAVVLDGFAPFVALVAGLGFLSLLGFFFIGWFRGEGGTAGSRSGGGGVGAAGGGGDLAARAGRSAARRVRASGVRHAGTEREYTKRELRKAEVVNDWATLEKRAREVNGYKG